MNDNCGCVFPRLQANCRCVKEWVSVWVWGGLVRLLSEPTLSNYKAKPVWGHRLSSPSPGLGACYQWCWEIWEKDPVTGDWTCCQWWPGQTDWCRYYVRAWSAKWVCWSNKIQIRVTLAQNPCRNRNLYGSNETIWLSSRTRKDGFQNTVHSDCILFRTNPIELCYWIPKGLFD